MHTNFIRSGMVYEDAEQYYAEVKEQGKALLDEAFGSLLQNTAPVRSRTGSGVLLAYNTTMFPRLEVIQVPLSGSGISNLSNVIVQTAEDGKTGFALLQAQEGLSFAGHRGLFADCNATSGK